MTRRGFHGLNCGKPVEPAKPVFVKRRSIRQKEKRERRKLALYALYRDLDMVDIEAWWRRDWS